MTPPTLTRTSPRTIPKFASSGYSNHRPAKLAPVPRVVALGGSSHPDSHVRRAPHNTTAVGVPATHTSQKLSDTQNGRAGVGFKPQPPNQSTCVTQRPIVGGLG